MELNEKIALAKKIVEDDWYALWGVTPGASPFKRKWSKNKMKTGQIVYAWEGTPDKGFVVVENDYSVIAKRMDYTVLKRFD